MFLFYHLSFCHGRLRFRFHLSLDDEAEVISVYGRGNILIQMTDSSLIWSKWNSTKLYLIYCNVHPFQFPCSAGLVFKGIIRMASEQMKNNIYFMTFFFGVQRRV